MTRKEIEESYDVRDGIIQSPGKFEGEPRYAPFYWNAGMEGCAYDEEEGDDGTPIWVFTVTEDDVKEFPELVQGMVVRIAEDDNGFVGVF